MTVSSEKVTAGPYPANGVASSFNYKFKIEKDDQLLVFVTDDQGSETQLTLNDDYGVSGVGTTNGYVNLNVAPAAGSSVYIISDYKFDQSTEFVGQGMFYPKIHENAYDKLTYLVLQLKERFFRSLRLGDSDPSAPLQPMPPLQVGKFLRAKAADEVEWSDVASQGAGYSRVWQVAEDETVFVSPSSDYPVNEIFVINGEGAILDFTPSNVIADGSKWTILINYDATYTDNPVEITNASIDVDGVDTGGSLNLNELYNRNDTIELVFTGYALGYATFAAKKLGSIIEQPFNQSLTLNAPFNNRIHMAPVLGGGDVAKVYTYVNNVLTIKADTDGVEVPSIATGTLSPVATAEDIASVGGGVSGYSRVWHVAEDETVVVSPSSPEPVNEIFVINGEGAILDFTPSGVIADGSKWTILINYDATYTNNPVEITNASIDVDGVDTGGSLNLNELYNRNDTVELVFTGYALGYATFAAKKLGSIIEQPFNQALTLNAPYFNRIYMAPILGAGEKPRVLTYVNDVLTIRADTDGVAVPSIATGTLSPVVTAEDIDGVGVVPISGYERLGDYYTVSSGSNSTQSFTPTIATDMHFVQTTVSPNQPANSILSGNLNQFGTTPRFVKVRFSVKFDASSNLDEVINLRASMGWKTGNKITTEYTIYSYSANVSLEFESIVYMSQFTGGLGFTVNLSSFAGVPFALSNMYVVGYYE